MFKLKSTIWCSAMLLSATALAAAPGRQPAVTQMPVNRTPIAVSPTEVVRAKGHTFKPPNGAIVIDPSSIEGPPLSLAPRTDGASKTGSSAEKKFNDAKFADTVHSLLKDRVRGYALGLRKNGKTQRMLYWDWARSPADGKKPWSLDTRIHVASISKLITAIVAVKMLDERNLTVDARIGPYLPDYWTKGNGSASLTFRQLLTHQAGFTEHGGDFSTFKAQIERGVNPSAPACENPPKPGCRLGYTNGTFSLVRVLNAIMTNTVPRSAVFKSPMPTVLPSEAANDVFWDLKTTDAFLAYAQSKVFTPSGVAGVSTEPNASGALAYASKTDTKGWDSGDVRGELGGAGFRLSVNDVLDVMGTFRRSDKIVSKATAKAAIEARLGIDQATSTARGTLYNKNGLWANGKSTTSDAEQGVAYYLPDDIELVVLTNSWVGTDHASLRGTISNAYTASLE